MERMISGMMLALLLVGLFVLELNIQPVKASGTIYIKADGSIDPPTAPISTVDNVTYILTANIASVVNGIVVERDNIVVDGAGYSIQGANSGEGMDLFGRSNVTIQNTNVKNLHFGILLYSSSSNSIIGNNITNNYCGIAVDSSFSNSISENNITNNNVDGILLDSSSSNSISGNNITNNRNGIELTYSSNNSVSGNNITTSDWFGILLDSSSSNSISENNITNNDYGISIEYTSSNSIIGNNITNNYWFGIWLDFSISNSISENNITNNRDGIGFSDSSNNIVNGNNVANNRNGVYLEFSSNYNSVIGNNVIANNENGISLDSSSSNNIFHNNFVNNTVQVNCTSDSTNVWDNGCEGNYWSDYNAKYPGGVEIDSSGIMNPPYVVDANNTDRYPLMNVFWSPCDINHDLKVDMKDIGIASRAYGTTPGKTLWNPHADITGREYLVPDSLVDMRDIGLIARHFGDSYIYP